MGTRQEVAWFKQALERRFEIKSSCVGISPTAVGGSGKVGSPGAPSPTVTNGEGRVEGSECRLLNRIVRCTQSGWEIEPDQRHADLLVQALELKGANGVTTPGENDTRRQEEDNEVELGPEEATNYRSIAARANYLSADRPDIMYAVKEL